MGVTTCRDCKKEVSTAAEKCPHCGAAKPARSKKPMSSGMGCLIFMGLFAVLFVMMIRGSREKAGSPNLRPSTTTTGSPTSEAATAITLVRRAVRTGIGIDPLRIGRLQDGYAILTDGDAAFWLSNGTVYAANGTAKTWAPGTEWAPAGVDFSAVQSATK